MDHIHALIRLAGRRMALTDFLRWLRDASILALVVICLYLGLERLGMVPEAPWFWWIPPVLIVALLIALLLWSRHRRQHLKVAITVDQQLGLDERLSSALMLAKSEDPFARAAIDDAIRTARLPQTRERVGRAFRVRAPQGWWIPLVLIAIAVGIFFTPSMATEQDSETEREDALFSDSPEQAKEQVAVSVSEVEAAIAEDEALAQAMEEALDSLAPEAFDTGEDSSAKEIRQDAIKKVTELNRRLEDLIEGEQSQTNQFLQKMLRDLAVQSTESKATDDLAKAMAQGDFKAAQEALQRLQEQMEKAADAGDKAGQEALAEQLAEMAAQLQELAKQQEQLAEALERAGLDGQLAKNPAALQQALQQSQNLTERQKEQLRKLAEAQKAAGQQCNQMGQSMQQMAEACKQGGKTAMGNASSQMSEQLSRMEMMQQMLQQAKAAQQMCVSQCQAMGQSSSAGQGKGNGNRQGTGTGDDGQGSGGQNSVQETAVSMAEVKANIMSDQGQIIARELFDGEIQSGVSTAPMQNVIRTAVEGFEDGMSEDPLPPYYDEVQKHYFGELEQLIKALGAATQNGTSIDEPEPSQDEDPTSQ